MIEIAPSILSADFARMAEALEIMRSGGADLVHVDVMDGHFVPNLTIGPPVVAALHQASDLPLDCHLMITEPDRYIPAFLSAGAARITVHQEACTHLHRTISSIHDGGALAGVSLNPATPIESLDEILPELDMVLIMSVNPGFSGQSFIPGSVDKVARLKSTIRTRGLSTRIQVDGGVGPATIGPLAAAGARSFVAGNAVFGTGDPAGAIAELRQAAETAV